MGRGSSPAKGWWWVMRVKGLWPRGHRLIPGSPVPAGANTACGCVWLVPSCVSRKGYPFLKWGACPHIPGLPGKLHGRTAQPAWLLSSGWLPVRSSTCVLLLGTWPSFLTAFNSLIKTETPAPPIPTLTPDMGASPADLGELRCSFLPTLQLIL